ncbi:MAG: DUF4114 domain-containing protein [Nitrospirales bacterium]|nr:DUF4114 domain-containing protein [Nitrospira sp.]MDR4501544.1 DUF4114 domain-containing protein [Nitrospirales bacterium]
MRLLPQMKYLAVNLCILALPAIALATPILGGTIAVKHDGNVTATFQGSSAGYISALYLGNTKLFSSTQNAGTTFDLGNFSAGTELQFRLEVQNTGHSFYTGSGANNSDGLAHAIVDESFGENETLVSFEDLLGGGDRDYNDLTFSFSNTNTHLGDKSSGSGDDRLVQNPEPSTVILLGSGILGLAAWRWKKERFLK